MSSSRHRHSDEDVLKYNDSLTAVALAYKKGDIAAEDLHLHICPRLDRLGLSEKEIQQVLNMIEVALHTLSGTKRTARVVELIRHAESCNAQIPPTGQHKMTEIKVKDPQAFEANYRFEMGVDIGPEATFEILDPHMGRSRSLLVRFIPDEGSSWLGRFWGGSERGVSGVTTWPDPGAACVLVSGVAYRGSVSDPASWKELAPEPTKAILAFPKHELIVFSDPWNLYAYGKGHEAWRVRDVSLDGFRVVSSSTDLICVEIERDTGDIEQLSVDVATGTIQREEG